MVKELNLPENLTGEWSIVHRRISPESSDLAGEEKKRKFLGLPILDQNSPKFIHRNTLFIYIPFRERKENMRERVFLSVQRVREWEREVGYRK